MVLATSWPGDLRFLLGDSRSFQGSSRSYSRFSFFKRRPMSPCLCGVSGWLIGWGKPSVCEMATMALGSAGGKSDSATCHMSDLVGEQGPPAAQKEPHEERGEGGEERRCLRK